MQQRQDLSHKLNAAAPALAANIDASMSSWLAKLTGRLERGRLVDARPKHLNDPIWSTIELYPWEVALLDTPFMQRLRGVRQLGLAQYVFPGAGHDRLEHVCGVVGAVEAMIQALRRQRERASIASPHHPLPEIGDPRRYELRLAGLLHDVGHGPFSHAIEPVLEQTSAGTSGDAAADWRLDIRNAQKVLLAEYQLNKTPSVSETIAVMMVASKALKTVLFHPHFPLTVKRPNGILVEAIIAAIVGAVAGPGADHLSRVVSSQIDADKLDYLARDAHHAGLEIGFETNRLLAKLEVLAVRKDRLGDEAEDLIKKAVSSKDGVYHDLGIAASGFGSFEQMLIGRTFLYDRLYHHHKVRAADAMAQRLALTAQEERGSRLTFDEVFAQVSDDAMIQILGGEVKHPAIEGGKERAQSLARAILDRELYHRAFAFRGRFIACPAALGEKEKEDLRQNKWRSLVKALDSLESRRELERAIFDLTKQIGQSLVQKFPNEHGIAEAIECLDAGGPEQIIVDLPENKADAIRILARYPNERLAVPEFSFNPMKWADAYDLQKRTGYVFCPQEAVALVGLAAKFVFLERFGVVMAKEADGYIKAPQISNDWLQHLKDKNLIDEAALQQLRVQRFSLLQIKEADISVPREWLEEDPDFGVRVASELDEILPAGLIEAEKEAMTKTLGGIFAFLDEWHAGSKVTQPLPNEKALQDEVRSALGYQGIKIVEGATASGGKYDLLAEGRIVIENKFSEVDRDPFDQMPSAGAQARRYAIALGARVVIVIMAYSPKTTEFPSKTKSVLVRKIDEKDDRRAEIRIVVPHGAVNPSRQKAPPTSAAAEAEQDK